jgi:predicted metal-dependent HD superfamily phosphohydrolase
MTDPIVEKYWAQLASRHDAEAFTTLDAAYREPQRAYHAWNHITDMLTKLDQLTSLATRPDLIAAATFWHDAVYLTREPDGHPRSDPENVRDSVLLFEKHAKFDPMERAAIHDIIMATSNHMKAKAKKEHYPGFSRDLDLFLDLDLSSLAVAWPVFEKNLEDIRFEFQWAPEQDFYLGRTRMLESFLGGGEKLFRLPETRALWLAAAQDNLKRAKSDLREKMAFSA